MKISFLKIMLLFVFVSLGCYKSKTADKVINTSIQDTVYLLKQIDSIDYFSSVGDTLNCQRLLKEFSDTSLAKQFPLFIYHAYFSAYHISDSQSDNSYKDFQSYFTGIQKQILDIAVSAGSEQLLIYSEYLAARHQSNLGNNTKAFPQFLSQLERFEKINDAYGQALLNKRIGMVYLFVYQEPEKATLYFTKALLLSPDEEERIISAGMLVKTYLYLNSEDSLLKYYRIHKSFSACKDEIDSAEVEACYHIMQYSRGETNSKRAANAYLNFLLDYFAKEYNNFWVNDFLGYTSQYSNLLIKQHQLQDADKLLQRLEILINNYHLVPLNELAFYDAKIKFLESKNNFTEAYRYLKKYRTMSDSLKLTIKQRQVELAAVEYHRLQQTKKHNTAIQSEHLTTQKYKGFSGLLISLIMLVVIFGFITVRQIQLRKRLETEHLRTRLSRDLHDDIGSTLSSINILSHTAQTTLADTENEKVKLSLEKINDRSQRLLDSMSDIIWNIKPGNDTIEEVMSRMREYATTILEAKNINYEFDFPKEKMDCRLTMDIKNNLYLIFKESVNNLAKYSACTDATLTLRFTEKQLQLTIKDNGKGFNQKELTHHGGLSNMQFRAEEMNGRLTIESTPGKGTRIALTMPRYC